LDPRRKKLSRYPRKEQEGNLIRKPEKKKRRGKKCKEANPLLKFPSGEITEPGPPKEASSTPTPVNNACSLLEL
jgi:hypothetical protein